MKSSEYDYLETKVEDTLRLLRRTNKRYSAASETEGELYRRVKRITETNGDVVLLEEERHRINSLLEQWVDIMPTVYAELYRRGYLDCLKLVVSLGSQDRG